MFPQLASSRKHHNYKKKFSNFAPSSRFRTDACIKKHGLKNQAAKTKKPLSPTPTMQTPTQMKTPLPILKKKLMSTIKQVKSLTSKPKKHNSPTPTMQKKTHI